MSQDTVNSLDYDNPFDYDRHFEQFKTASTVVYKTKTLEPYYADTAHIRIKVDGAEGEGKRDAYFPLVGPYGGEFLIAEPNGNFECFAILFTNDDLRKLYSFASAAIDIEKQFPNHPGLLLYSATAMQMMLIIKCISFEQHAVLALRVLRFLQADETVRLNVNNVGLFCGQFAMHLNQLANALTEGLEQPTEIQAATDGGVHWLDERAAKYFERYLGNDGQQLANSLRNSSRKRYTSYVETLKNAPDHNGCTIASIKAGESLLSFWITRQENKPFEPFLIGLGSCLLQIIKKQHELNERKRRNPPAITATVASIIPDACGWKKQVKVVEDLSTGETLVINQNHLPPQIVARAPAIEAKRGSRIFGTEVHAALKSRAGQELIRWVIEQVHGNTYDQRPDPRKITREGGLDAICEELGLAKGRDSKILYDALVAGKRFELLIPGEIHQLGLWTASIEGGKGRRPAILTIEASSFLAPHHKLAICNSDRLVPVIPTPPLVGRRNDYSAQTAFKWEIVRAMVNAGSDILEGGVLLTSETLEHLAQSVSLPIPTLWKALERWTEDKEDGPRMLDKKGDRFLLSDTAPYRNARAFILEGAIRSQENSKRGRKGHQNNK